MFIAAPVIIPTSIIELRSNQTQQFTADQDVVWTCSRGSISTEGLYTPPKVNGIYTVTATNVSAQVLNRNVLMAQFSIGLLILPSLKNSKQSFVFLHRAKADFIRQQNAKRSGISGIFIIRTKIFTFTTVTNRIDHQTGITSLSYDAIRLPELEVQLVTHLCQKTSTGTTRQMRLLMQILLLT